jgi:hypothetical protein
MPGLGWVVRQQVVVGQSRLELVVRELSFKYRHGISVSMDLSGARGLGGWQGRADISVPRRCHVKLALVG